MAPGFSESLDEFPRKPIKVIVPFGPGGASDTLARIVQEAVRRDELSPQPFAIINVPGAGGTIGSRRAKNARPDGYTILNLHDGLLTAKYTGHDYGPEAFIPVAATGSSHTVLCVGPSGKWASVDQILEDAVQAPDEIKFGMNLGAPSHFVGLQLQEKKENARFRMVALQGGADRFEKLVGGHIDLSIFSVSEYLQFRRTEGRPNGLKAIAYLGPKRHPQLAGTPTGKEVGVDLVTGTTQFWWAPLGTPSARIEKLADILEDAMNSEWLQKRYAEKSVEPICLRGPELLAAIEEADRQLASLQVDGQRQVGPNVPIIPAIGGGVLVLGIGSLILGFGRRSSNSAQQKLDWRSATVVAAMLGYLLILNLRFVPFWLATVLFVGGVGWLLAPNLRAVRRIAIGGLVLGLSLQLLFQHVLIIDLP